MIKVLIIDDEAHVRKLYQDLLSRENFEVSVTDNAEQAMILIQKYHIDIVVLDIELKNESGLDILNDFKSKYPELPIILNSAYSIYMSDFKTWMAEAYILKSSDIRPLVEKIKELTGTKVSHG